jgi:hypothetical protein
MVKGNAIKTTIAKYCGPVIARQGLAENGIRANYITTGQNVPATSMR